MLVEAGLRILYYVDAGMTRQRNVIVVAFQV